MSANAPAPTSLERGAAGVCEMSNEAKSPQLCADRTVGRGRCAANGCSGVQCQLMRARLILATALFSVVWFGGMALLTPRAASQAPGHNSDEVFKNIPGLAP